MKKVLLLLLTEFQIAIIEIRARSFYFRQLAIIPEIKNNSFTNQNIKKCNSSCSHQFSHTLKKHFIKFSLIKINQQNFNSLFSRVNILHWGFNTVYLPIVIKRLIGEGRLKICEKDDFVSQFDKLSFLIDLFVTFNLNFWIINNKNRCIV